MNPLPVQLASGVASGGLEIVRSLAGTIPGVIGLGATPFGDLLSQHIGDRSTAVDAVPVKPAESAEELASRQDSEEATQLLQDRIQQILSRHGIEFGAGMSLQLSSAGRLRVDDHPQAARIESIIRDDPELRQLLTGLLTSIQLREAGAGTENSLELPALDDLTVHLRPELRKSQPAE